MRDLGEKRAKDEGQVVGQQAGGDACKQAKEGTRARLLQMEDGDQDAQGRFHLALQAGHQTPQRRSARLTGVATRHGEQLDMVAFGQDGGRGRVVKAPSSNTVRS